MPSKVDKAALNKAALAADICVRIHGAGLMRLYSSSIISFMSTEWFVVVQTFLRRFVGHRIEFDGTAPSF